MSDNPVDRASVLANQLSGRVTEILDAEAKRCGPQGFANTISALLILAAELCQTMTGAGLDSEEEFLDVARSVWVFVRLSRAKDQKGPLQPKERA